MVSKARAERVAERVREELSEIFIFEISDPRLQGVFITDVLVDRELAYANIFVSALEGSEMAEEVLAGLEHARGFLRSKLAKQVNLRSFPQLRFHWDPTPENAERMEKLIDSLQKKEDPEE